MENNRYEPYGVNRPRGRQYKRWMYAENPTAPRATVFRQRRQAVHNQFEREINQINREPSPPRDQGVVRLPNENLEDEVGAQELRSRCGSPDREGESNSRSSEHSDSSGDVQSHNSDDNDIGGNNAEDSDFDGGNGDAFEDDDNDRGDENVQERGWRPNKVPEFDEPFFPPLPCTKYECLLKIWSFGFRHGLTQVAMLDLCKLINNIFGGDYLPKSNWFFNKIFGKPVYVCHFYCSKCFAYIRSKDRDDPLFGSHECEICNTTCNFNNMNNGNFFVTFSMKDQLKLLLENTSNIMEYLNHRFERTVENDNISDIYDGKVYSNLSKPGNFLSQRKNLSLTFNTDGAAVFETHHTLWPILYSINEFPPEVRFDQENILLAGIWFGRCEPKMHLFLSSFVRELEHLYDTGFTWASPQGNIIRSKVILLNCVADSKARPHVQGVKMHNGYYGCGHCNHPGVMYDGSNQAKYPINDDLVLMRDYSYSYTVNGSDPVTKEDKRFAVEDRTNLSIRRDMEAAERNRNEAGEGEVNGVREKCILWNVPHFDLSFGFTIDYMHAVLVGVTSRTANFWFDSTTHRQPYHVGDMIAQVDARLQNIKPPVAISRRPQSIALRGEWHANEWRSWLLYYSIPCLEGILVNRYLKHHCLLVSAIYLLLRTNISRATLRRACMYLGQYVVDFKHLYGGSLTYFNVHLLLHLGKCVDMWGPLFCFSAFAYENANRCIVNLVKGSSGLLSQIGCKYTRAKLLPYTMELYNVSQNTMDYCSDLLYFRSSKVVQRHGVFTILGTKKIRTLSNEERTTILQSGHNVSSESYERMIVAGSVVHARCYSRKGEKSFSSLIQCSDQFVCVLERIIDPENYRGEGPPKFLALFRKVNVIWNEAIITNNTHGAKAAHIKPCAPLVYGDLQIIEVDKIFEQLIFIDCINSTYVAKFPNRIERD